MITEIRFGHCRKDAHATYTIYDSDFEPEEVVVGMINNSGNPYVYECVKIIINVCKERQLNVSATIAHWLGNNTYCAYQHIEQCKIHVPDYTKYADDVEKYLLLM